MRTHAWIAVAAILFTPTGALAAEQFCDPILDLASRGQEAVRKTSHPDPFGRYQGELIHSGDGPQDRTFRSTFQLPGAKFCTLMGSWSTEPNSTLDCIWNFASLTEAKREAARLNEQIKQCFPGTTWNGLEVDRRGSGVYLGDPGSGAAVVFDISTDENDGESVCALFYDDEGVCEFHQAGDDNPKQVPYMELVVKVSLH